jgi:hypothetical protein
MMQNLLNSALSRCCAVDLRALALFRVGLAMTLLADLCSRAPHMFAFYSDSGVLPRAALLDKITPPWSLSLLLANGQQWFVVAYFLATAFAALFVLVGWRTKAALIAMWLLTIGLNDRNPAPNQAGDGLLMIIQFWALFLPIERVWSVDAALKRETNLSESWCGNFASLATFCYLIQLTFLYLMSGLLKTADAWRDGTAVLHALSLDSFVSDFGIWLRGFPQFCAVATHVTVYAELVAPIFFFIPWKRDLFRLIIFCCLSLMHISFSAALHIGVFGLTDIVALLPLLPSCVFRGARSWLIDPRAKGTTITVFSRDSQAWTQAHITRELLLPDAVSIRSDEGNCSKGDPHVPLPLGFSVRNARGDILDYPTSLAALLRLSKINRILMAVMGTRLSVAMVTTTSERLAALAARGVRFPALVCSAPTRAARRYLVRSVLLYSLAFITVVNIQSTGVGDLTLPPWLMLPGRLLHLSQKWSMFNPPPKSNNWFIIPGKLDDGSPVDVLSGTQGEVSSPPSRIPSETSIRWRKFYEQLRRKDVGPHYRLFFGKYLCRRWNTGKGERSRRLKTFSLILVSEPILQNGERGEQRRTSLHNHICYKDEGST